MTSRALSGLVAALAACAEPDARVAEPGAPSASASTRASPKEPVGGPKRPEQIASLPFSYLDLPLMEPARPLADPISFDLRDEPTGLRLGLSRPGLVGRAFYAGATFVTPLADSAPRAVVADGPACPKQMPAKGDAAIVEAVAVDGFTRDHLRFVRFEAAVDREHCSGVSGAASEVVARALIPNLLYGFRRCIAACGSSRDRGEELVVIGPPTTWVSASIDPGVQGKPKPGPFSVASAPLRAGSSAALLLHADWNEVTYFVGLRGPKGRGLDTGDPRLYGQRIELTAEVAWPSDSDTVDGIAYVSGVTPHAALMVQVATRPE